MRRRGADIRRLRHDVAVLRLGNRAHRLVPSRPEPRGRGPDGGVRGDRGVRRVLLVLHLDPSLEHRDARGGVRGDDVDGVRKRESGAEPRGYVPGIRTGVRCPFFRRLALLLLLRTFDVGILDVGTLGLVQESSAGFGDLFVLVVEAPFRRFSLLDLRAAAELVEHLRPTPDALDERAEPSPVRAASPRGQVLPHLLLRLLVPCEIRVLPRSFVRVERRPRRFARLDVRDGFAVH